MFINALRYGCLLRSWTESSPSLVLTRLWWNQCRFTHVHVISRIIIARFTSLGCCIQSLTFAALCGNTTKKPKHDLRVEWVSVRFCSDRWHSCLILNSHRDPPPPGKNLYIYHIHLVFPNMCSSVGYSDSTILLLKKSINLTCYWDHRPHVVPVQINPTSFTFQGILQLLLSQEL